jgi:hypothetical protein
MLAKQATVEPRFPMPPAGLTWRIAGIAHFLEYLKHLGTVAESEWGSLVIVSPMFFFNESSKRCPVVILPCRVTIPGELVRINIDFSKVVSPLAFKNLSILDQLKPLFVSLGKIFLDEKAETFIILRGDLRE